MTKNNELVIDGVRTSSFPFQVIVEEPPSIEISESKTALLEHDGINGAVVQTNKHRGLIEKSYTLQVIGPTEEQLNEFIALFTRESFWLESQRVKTTKWWCYKAKVSSAVQRTRGLYVVNVAFTCHPTKFFKDEDTQTLTSNGVLKAKGSALAFPKITIIGSSASETTFTVGNQVIKLEKLTEPLVMINNPNNPSLLSASGKRVKWAGDFITVDPVQKSIGVVLGPGIQSLKFETVWGWA